MVGPGGIRTGTRIGPSNFRLIGIGPVPVPVRPLDRRYTIRYRSKHFRILIDILYANFLAGIQTLVLDFEFWRKISIFGPFFSNFCIKIIT